MPYKKITILSKDIIEIKTYDTLNLASGGDISDIEKGEGKDNAANYNKTQVKRRTQVRQLVTCNFNEESKFLTLTFGNEIETDIKDVKQCNKLFRKFITKLRRKYNDFKYLAVIEFQDKKGRGAVHYHMISNLPYIPHKELSEIWGNGFIFVNRITHVDNIGAYVVKYMNKNLDDTRLKGLKAYNYSLNLIQPTILRSWSNIDSPAVNDFMNYIKEKSPVYSTKYTSEEAGLITYQQFNFNRTYEKNQELIRKQLMEKTLCK